MALIKDKFKGWTILVVEDEPDSMEVATRWLKLAGAKVLTAEDGKTGLEAATAHTPTLIITDLTMPEMDGWELLTALRQHEATGQIPVIALTAHALRAVKEQALEAGFVAHISKPLSPTKFVEQVIAIVKNVPSLPAIPE